MHILISALHRPSKPTGVCRHAVNLAQCLADTVDISKVTILIGVWQKYYFETFFDLCSEKINLVGIDIKNSSISRNLWFLYTLPQLVKELSPDIVHLSFPLPFWRSHFPCPVVTTVHDLYPYECPENFGRIQSFFNRLFLRQCIYQSNGLCCVSNTTLERLKFFLPSSDKNKQIDVIYNYVDFSNIIPQAPKEFIESSKNLFLLSVAQHRKNKNLDLLIKAYSILLKNGQLDSSTQLVLVGSSGPETENLSHQIQDLDLRKRVCLLSAIGDNELCWLYQHCTAFVIPSSTEGFCLPLVEALSLSCKVICSDIPIFREIALSECTYFDLRGDSLNHLCGAITQTICQPSAQDSKTLRFSKSEIARQYLNFYSETIKKLDK
jgi:glycosyltransferase involved in cell wall biosynthesis